MAGENNGASAGICDQSEEGLKRMGVSQCWSYVFFPKALEKQSFWVGVRFRGLVWWTKHLNTGGIHGSAARLLPKKKERRKEEKKRQALWEQMERWSNINEASFPSRAASQPARQPDSQTASQRYWNKAPSVTCCRAFPVCCSHDNEVICPPAPAVHSQSGASEDLCSDFKTRATAGGQSSRKRNNFK